MAEESTGKGFTLSVMSQLMVAAIVAVAPIAWAAYRGNLAQTVSVPLWVYIGVIVGILVITTVGMLLITGDLRREISAQARALESSVKDQAELAEAIQERDNNLGEQLQHWAKAEKGFKGRIATLEGELAERDKVVYKDGLYYRPTDTERKQPFCRICWESRQKLTTIIDRTTLDNGYRYYECPVCGEQHQLPSIPVADPDAYEPLEDDGYQREPQS